MARPIRFIYGYTKPFKNPLCHLDTGRHVVAMLKTDTGLVISTGCGYLQKYTFDNLRDEVWRAGERAHYGQLCQVRKGVIAVSYEDNYIVDILDEETGKKIHELRWIDKDRVADGYAHAIKMIAMIDDDTLLAVHADGVFNVWDVRSWRVSRSWMFSQRRDTLFIFDLVNKKAVEFHGEHVSGRVEEWEDARRGDYGDDETPTFPIKSAHLVDGAVIVCGKTYLSSSTSTGGAP